MAIVPRLTRNAAYFSGGQPQRQATSKRGLTGMSASERLDSKADPLGHLSQAYFGGLDVMVKGYEPVLKGVGRWNLELIGFMARRARAWVDIGSQLGQCKSPVEIFKVQTKFLQAASAD